MALSAMSASSGQPNLALIILFAATGAFTGDQIAYTIGKRLNIRRIPFLAGPRGQKTLDWAGRALARRGAAVIFAARYIPVGRVAVNMTAGAVGYSRGQFVGFDAIAALIWALYSAAIGVGAGEWFKGHPLGATAVGSWAVWSSASRSNGPLVASRTARTALSAQTARHRIKQLLVRGPDDAHSEQFLLVTCHNLEDGHDEQVVVGTAPVISGRSASGLTWTGCDRPEFPLSCRAQFAASNGSPHPSETRGDRSPIRLWDDQGGVEQRCHVLRRPRSACETPWAVPGNATRSERPSRLTPGREDGDWLRGKSPSWRRTPQHVAPSSARGSYRAIG
jgi:membrane protein DedA with SNARE-associated domain